MSLEKLTLREISELILEDRIDQKYCIVHTDRGSTYKLGNRYVKHLYFKKHKFYNFLGYCLKENYQLKNLRRVYGILQNEGINTYDIKGFENLQRDKYIHGFYEAQEVVGEVYCNRKDKQMEIYRRAFSEYVRMLKCGIYEYDFGSNNFLIDDRGEIVFIDFDESKTSIFRKRYLIKSLSKIWKDFQWECRTYGLDWDRYRKEFSGILERELGLSEEKVLLYMERNYIQRKVCKKIRHVFRILRGKESKLIGVGTKKKYKAGSD